MKIEEVDVLVIGAGPSGSVSSAYLNNNNVKVKVVEKAAFPRPVIGESLIPRVMDHFDEVGLIPAITKAGFEKKWGARFIRDDETCVFDFGDKFGEGWDWTWQVPRADFDLVIANEVQRQGVEIEFESEVINVEFNDSDSITTIQDKEGNKKQIKAKFIIDSSGYGRVLPTLMNLDAPSSVSGNSSIFTHTIDVNRPKGEEGTMITFDILETKVWFWVIPFSNGVSSLGVVGPTEFIESLSKNGDSEEAIRKVISLSKHYKERFIKNEFLFKPVMLKNYSCSVSQLYGKGFALTGNSSGFLDPVFSSGVAFATESGILSAKLITRQLNGEEVDWETEYSDYIRRGVAVFSTYVSEWYTGNLQKVFFHQPSDPEVKRKICAVLAGYVWNEENPFVKKHHRAIKGMAYAIDMLSS
ncbi:MAG TPA: NAD(P)/FAD-dependent oxidoreductase [Brumimicrobium sp.]|nr:NAD(P)/FAD-dependent oxidoreductase [Brumimicrobium sp.]